MLFRKKQKSKTHVNDENEAGLTTLMEIVIKHYPVEILDSFCKVLSPEELEATINYESKTETGFPYWSTYKGCTALHCAVSYDGQLDVVNKLLDYNADVKHLHPRTGSTPLIVAAFYNCCSVSLRLMDKGAELNHVNKNGKTPLYYAITHPNPIMIKKMLEQRADPNLGKETKALELAMSKKDLSLVNLLIYYGATIPNFDALYNFTISSYHKYSLEQLYLTKNQDDLLEILAAFYLLLKTLQPPQNAFNYESQIREIMQSLSPIVMQYQTRIYDGINADAKPTHIPLVVSKLIGEYVGLFTAPKRNEIPFAFTENHYKMCLTLSK